MSEALCRCDRPIHDTAYVCTRCAAHLGVQLDGVGRIAGDITITVAKLAIVTRGIGLHEDLGWWKNADALEAVPLIVDLERGERHDAAVMELSTVARMIVEDRGAPNRRWVGYAARPPKRMHPLAELVLVLSANVEWLRHQPFADDVWTPLLDACAELVRIVDTRPAGKLVCMCSCGKRLYAQEHEQTVSCSECDLSYEVATARADLLTQGRELAVTPAEAADLIAGWVDPNANREKVRNLVRQWAHRGLIEAEGDGLYRLGPILDRWTRALAARVA
jgi:hypothetical protein